MSFSTVKMASLKADVLGEVVAGQIWMHLSMPADASRAEVEKCAGDLIRAAEYGDWEQTIEQMLRRQQADQFAGPVNSLTIKLLARRALDMVRRNRLAQAPVPVMRRTG
jgi:hypothetical protein